MAATRVPQLDATLVREEIEEAMREAARGNNPDKVPPDHQTQAEFDRRVIAALMQNTSIETTIAALPFWTAHQARSGNNNVQRAATVWRGARHCGGREYLEVGNLGRAT
jgi:hypothetical protein